MVVKHIPPSLQPRTTNNMPGYRHKQVGNYQAANRLAAKILKANQTSQTIQISDQQHQLLQQYYTQYNQLKYVVYNK